MEKLLAKPVGLVAAGVMLIVATLVPNGHAAAHFEVEENEPGENLKLGGTIEAISENSITILGLQFQVNEATDIEGILQVGEFAKVEFNVAEGTTLVALEIEAEDELDENDGDDQDDPEDEDLQEGEDTDDLEDSKVTGVVEAFSESSITINGQVYTFDGDTELDEGLQVGVIATIEFVTLPDGTLLATEVETDADDDAGEDDQDDDEDEDEDEEEDDDNSGSGSSGEEHENDEDDGDDD